LLCAPIEWSVLHNTDYLKKLPDEEQQQAARYKHLNGYKVLLRVVCCYAVVYRYTKISKLEWRFLRHNQRLILDNTQTALHTSLSHSANWVACVLSLSLIVA
jgi:phosphopantetheinyl transferase